jgi:peptidyl-prolyl cis-trans isomerase SurA
MTASRGTREFQVSEIFVSGAVENSADGLCNPRRIVQQLRQGASFAAYARQCSEASTRGVGGDLGWIRAEQLPPELAAAVTEIPVGAISEPIGNSGGYSILEVRDARQFLMADERDAVLSLMQMAIGFPPGSTPAQAQARIEELTRSTQNMGGCGNAQATATRLGAELVSNDQVRVRDLPPQLQPLLLRLAVGQATPPIGSAQERVSVLILCGRDDPAAAETPTFDQIYGQLSEDRANRRAQRVLRDLRRDAVVEYR